MRFAKWLIMISVAVCVLALSAPFALAAKPSLEKWKPAFDYSKAKYKIKVSNVSHPAIKGVYAGFAIRDALWKETKGQIYFEYLPFSMLGGEVEVLNQLQMGAVQGMSCSSVASTNLGPRMGIVNLPFLINSYDKLDKFTGNKKMFQHYLDGMKHQGIMGVDVTAYGRYGWASTLPIKTIADAKKVKFRIAEAAVNKLSYKAWGFNPVVMPWPDVPTALKQGVITALDHTLIVCYLTRKFEVAKYFTQINYAQGLFVWIFNEGWFKSLPADLQKTLIKVVKEQAKIYRGECKKQEAECISAAKKKGIKFFEMSKGDIATLTKEADAVHKKFAKEIGADYLKQVQDYLGYMK